MISRERTRSCHVTSCDNRRTRVSRDGKGPHRSVSAVPKGQGAGTGNRERWEGTGIVWKSTEAMDARGSPGQQSGRRFGKTLKRRPFELRS